MTDVYDLWVQYDNRKEAAAEKMPVCSVCGNPIWDEYYFEIHGDIVCRDCVIDYLHDNCRVENVEV